MAEELLVKEFLSDAMIRSGAEITGKLDEINWHVTASFWFYSPDENQWRLIFASPNVNKEGPRKAYQNILKALKKLPEGTLRPELRDIYVIDVSHHLIPLMRKMIKTEKNISGIRLSKNVIDGNYIDDAFIYRI